MKYAERIDRIELMHTFIRILESGSLSAAARQLNLSQASVSRRLSTLEKLLGVKLLMRNTHSLKLTDDGERCYQHAKQLTSHWLSLEEELKQASDEPVGTLRVRVPHAFGQQQLIEPLIPFLEKYPQLNIEWKLRDILPDFLAEDIDCAIHVGFEPNVNTVAILLAEVPRIVVASPQLLAKHPPVRQLQDLAHWPWVAVSLFYQDKVSLHNHHTQQSDVIQISPRLSTDNLFVTKNAVLAGLGVAMVSSWIVKDELATGQLVQILPEWSAAPIPIYLIYPWADYYPARLRQFLALMKQVMPNIVGVQAPDTEKI
ncbi:LysR family transcriptional regulator [Acinetobacter sp. MD2]|uniref:LysR family transcriptional regulator n=1 Tax=Acinetobacter sp. MD2 TaxID=2600066 RepID=UPI002D1F4E13|nr:LysR family transcriptional regulator [Acinetobacter sp. MD2]MEB3766783.1 LysR family transcriptional regulator [Acinetobacter sp. MD2]